VLHIEKQKIMIQMVTSIVCKEALMGRITEYCHATSWQDAYAKAKELGPCAAYVGGGVELVLRRNPEITTLIDLSCCGLDRIETTADGIQIGSQVTLSKISCNADVRQYAGGSLAYLAGHIAHNNLRNMITIGGAVGRNQPWNDVVPHLVALGARIRLYDGAEHVLPLGDYIRAKRPGALIKSVTLPVDNSHFRGYFWRFTRTRQDISLLHFSAVLGLEGDAVSAATMVYAGRPGGTAGYPQLAAELIGRRLAQGTFAALADLAPTMVEVGDDLRATGEFRHALVKAAIISLGEHMTGVTQ
jgi:CO/xanthine dehydrogenase FAD-binding subunit